MNRILRAVLFFSCLFLGLITPGTGNAQNSCGEEKLNEARKKYETGNFEQVISILQPCMASGFNEKQRLGGYRLLAMTYLAIDSARIADAMIVEMLVLNPNYEPDLFDPPMFIRAVNGIKESGSAILVKSVSKKAENLYEAPATVMIVTDKDLKERGYVDMEAFFSDLPGFDISRPYGSIYSNLYQRGYRSNETNRTLFLMDGVEENNLWSNTANWNMQYPISNVKRVEVIYGPASTMYGANAFTGVVNVITKEPEEVTKGKSFGVNAQAGYGTYNSRYGDMTMAGKYKSISFSLTGRKYLSDQMDLSKYPEYDYDPAFYETINYKKLLSVTSNAQKYFDDNNLSETSSLYTLVRDSTDKIVSILLSDSGAMKAMNLDKQGVTGKTFHGKPLKYSNSYDDWLVNGKLRIGDFTLGFQHWKIKHGGTNIFNDNNLAGAENGNYFAPKQTLFYVKYEKNLNDKVVVSNSVQYQVHEIDNQTTALTVNNYSNGKYKLSDLAKNKAAAWMQIYMYQISKQLRNEFKVIYTPNRNFDIVSGIEVRNSLLQGNYLISLGLYPSDSGYAGGSPTAQGQILGGNTYDIRDFGIYSQATYRLMKTLKLTLGGRLDHNKIRSLGGYGNQFNPRIVLVYTPEKFIFKAIYSEAIKDADNWTKFATSEQRKLPSPSLEPEKARNLEISAAYNKGKDLYVEVNGFKDNYTGVIGTREVPYQGGTTTQNAPIGSMEIIGLESKVNYKYLNYTAYLNYTYIINTKSVDKGITSEIGDISKHKANFGINALYFNKLNLNLRVNYIGDRKTGPGTSVPLNPGTFGANTVVNMAVGYELKWGFTLQLLCDNLLDANYFDPGVRNADGGYNAYRLYQKGRNFMFKLVYDFNK